MAACRCPVPSRVLLVCLLLELGFELASAGDRRRKKLNHKNAKARGSHNTKAAVAQEAGRAQDAADQTTALQSDLDAANKEKTALRNQVKTAEEEAMKQARRISDLMQQLSQQEQRISQLTSELVSKQPQIDQKAKDLEDKTQTVASLREQMSVQSKKIAKLTELLSTVRIQYQDLSAKYDDPPLQHFLAAKAHKVYLDPGIQGAANKTFVYVLPAVEGLLQDHVVTLYNSTYDSVEARLQDILGGSGSGDWIPAVSSFLVYGLFTLPFAFALTCLVEFVCRVKYILLACSFYLFCLSVGASCFVAYTREDPMSEFAEQDAGVYLWAQAAFFATFVIYFLILSGMCILSCLHTDTPLSEVISRGAQCFALLAFGIGYYQLVWTPAMVDEMPKVEAFMAQFDKQQGAKGGEETKLALNLMLVPYIVCNGIFLMVFAIEEGIWHDASDKVSPEEKEEKGE